MNADSVALNVTVGKLTSSVGLNTTNNSIAFNNLIAGTPVSSPSATPLTTVATCTNCTLGYNLYMSDTLTTSSLYNGTAYIPDYSGTFTSPTQWVDGTSKGLGVSLLSSTAGKEAKWVSGYYAGVPSTTTTAIHSISTSVASDTCTFGWKLDVPSTQATGAYTGNVTVTAVANPLP
jgi:hypothetical protein